MHHVEAEGARDELNGRWPLEADAADDTDDLGMVEEDSDTIKEIYPSYDPESKTCSEADGDIYNTELRVVVPDEDSPLKAEMFRPETQFFYFNDFKRWLDKRQLVSS